MENEHSANSTSYLNVNFFIRVKQLYDRSFLTFYFTLFSRTKHYNVNFNEVTLVEKAIKWIDM